MGGLRPNTHPTSTCSFFGTAWILIAVRAERHFQCIGKEIPQGKNTHAHTMTYNDMAGNIGKLLCVLFQLWFHVWIVHDLMTRIAEQSTDPLKENSYPTCDLQDAMKFTHTFQQFLVFMTSSHLSIHAYAKYFHIAWALCRCLVKPWHHAYQPMDGWLASWLLGGFGGVSKIVGHPIMTNRLDTPKSHDSKCFYVHK